MDNCEQDKDDDDLLNDFNSIYNQVLNNDLNCVIKDCSTTYEDCDVLNHRSNLDDDHNEDRKETNKFDDFKTINVSNSKSNDYKESTNDEPIDFDELKSMIRDHNENVNNRTNNLKIDELDQQSNDDNQYLFNNLINDQLILKSKVSNLKMMKNDKNDDVNDVLI